MFCPNCGNKVEEGGKFCPYCGANLEFADDAQQPNGAPGHPNGANERAGGGNQPGGSQTYQNQPGGPQTYQNQPGGSQAYQNQPGGPQAYQNGTPGANGTDKGKKGGKWIWVLIGAAVILVLLVVFLLIGLFAGAGSDHPDTGTVTAGTEESETPGMTETAAAEIPDEEQAYVLDFYTQLQDNEIISYELNEKAKSFLTENYEYFPLDAEGGAVYEENAIDYSIETRDINKNADKFGDRLMAIWGAGVVQIREFSYGDDVATYLNLVDGEGNQYLVYYLGELPDVYENDVLSLVIGLPLGVGTFDNTGGGSTWAVVLAGSYISEDSLYVPGEDSVSVGSDETFAPTEGDPGAGGVSAAEYWPGMEVDGIYVFDNGTDAVCTADVNLSNGYFSVECTGYGGNSLYAYFADEYQEADTGAYWIGNEYAEYTVTFTDGGMYMELGSSYQNNSSNEYLAGYYVLAEPYDPSLAGIDFAGGSIFPDSSQRLLTNEDLRSVAGIEIIRYAKNEIYARHGRVFASPDLDAYFRSKNWYAGTIPPEQFDESVLNETEKANVAFLQDFYENWGTWSWQ